MQSGVASAEGSQAVPREKIIDPWPWRGDIEVRMRRAFTRWLAARARYRLQTMIVRLAQRFLALQAGSRRLQR
jgi:hypothetical protein